jgi:tetratricopeptide (TPR) repeat protein
LNIDLPEALGHYTRTLEFGFDEFWVRVHRGRLYYALGNEQAAEADFARAAEIQPEEAGAKAALNSARLSPVWRKFNAGQYEVVAREGRDLLRLQDSPEVRYLVAHSLHSLHIDLAEALRHYDRALELGFNEFWVRVHRGRLRRTLGDEAGAKADFSRAAELQPDERSAREAFASATHAVAAG